MPLQSNRPITDVLTDFIMQSGTLLRQESELARTEMSEKVGQVAGALISAMIGAVLLIPAIVILLQAAVQGLEQAGLASPWSSLIVGGGVLAIGVILLIIGVNRLRVENLVPKKTIHQLQESVAVARREASTTHDYERAA